MSITESILSGIANYQKTPSSIMHITLDALESALNGDDIVDATSPFIFLLEASATSTAAAINEGESLIRRVYPELANTENDLNYHLSDQDYIDRFATPATGIIKLLIPMNELRDNAVTLNDTTRRVKIPTETIFTVLGYDLGIYYPILIDILPNDILHVNYDLSISNKLHSINTNRVDNRRVILSGIEYLELTIPVEQFSIQSETYPLSPSSDFKEDINFTDSFYYARVFMDYGNSEWVEIDTTHSNVVYDITRLTAVLEVVDDTLYVRIPDIYNSNGVVGGSIRIDIYTTRGELDVKLEDVPTSAFAATWRLLDKYESNAYVAPLNAMNDMIIYSEDSLFGGAAKRSIEETKKRVVYRVGNSPIPIRTSDIEIGLKDKGYTVIHNTESPTSRSYIASKELLENVRNGLRSTILATNESVIYDEALAGSGMDHSKSMSSNGKGRTTILPTTLYKSTSTGLHVLTDTEIVTLETLPIEARLKELNQNTYLYSPFHYVLDSVLKGFRARAYHLTSPTLKGRSHVDSNSKKEFNLNTRDLSIELIDNAYVITVTADLPENVTSCNIQLRYKDSLLLAMAYLNADVTITTSEIIGVFRLNTSFDITDTDVMELTNMSNLLGTPIRTYMQLEQLFDIFYIVEDDRLLNSSSFDDQISFNGMPDTTVGATHETVVLRLGERLEGLYLPAKSLLTVPPTTKYLTDVPATYTEIVYANDANGKLYTVNDTGNVKFTILHNVDDPILDGNGDPIIIHKAGDDILDSTGATIPDVSKVAYMRKQIGVTLLDAIYKFGNTPEVIAYRDRLSDTILNYLNLDIMPAGAKLHERSSLLYRPRGVLGDTLVTVGNGQTILTPSDIDFSIIFYIKNNLVENLELREIINRSVRVVLSEHILRSTLSVSEISKDINSLELEGVVGFDIQDLGPDKDINIMTLLDPSTSFSINEVLAILPDGTIDIQDTIDIQYKSVI